MGVCYGTCGHDITGYFERTSAWWRSTDRDGSPGWSYGSLCDDCFISYGAQREEPGELKEILALPEPASPRQDAPQPPQDARTGPPEARATPNTKQHVLEVVLQNATVRVDVAGTIRCCTVAQPGPGRMEPIVTLDGKPWLVSMTLEPEEFAR